MSCGGILFRFLLVLVLCAVPGAWAVGAVAWKPERMLGSAQLSIDAVQYLVVPAEAGERLSAAAQDFIEVAGKRGITLTLVGAPERPRPKNAVVLVEDKNAGNHGALTEDSYVIRRERTRVSISSATEEGLANGLYAIARELLGARWYWSGDLGFELVGEAADTFPDRIWCDQPAFVQRTLYPVATDFGRRNGLNRKYSFNHNLARIFTREVYETSPEVFAKIGGHRRLPKESAGYDPQPDFTHPEAIDLAAKAAREHFQQNPGANSFSLSINDNSLFDEGAATEAVVRGITSGSEDGSIEYFRGRPNYTDLVFGFMNEVAERLYARGQGPEGRRQRTEVGEQEPMVSETSAAWPNVFSTLISSLASAPCPLSSEQKPYLTALAYYWTEQSPSFQIHPQVMPVLTSDRAQWQDPNYRAEDKALIRRWANSGASRIATWDYYFGAPYPYPRQFTQWIGESISYLHESGVDVFFTQLPSVWGLDGPKAWLTAELLRDPEQKVEALLDEFYQNFFGAAAEPIRRFYEIAEQTRNERAGTANWIKFYKDEAGIELFTPESLSRMRECISLAEARVSDDSRRLARVRIVSEAFSYTESYANYHASRTNLVQLAMAAFGSESQGMDDGALGRALADYREAKASFGQLKKKLVEHPLQRGFSTFNRLVQSEPEALALAALAHTDFTKDDKWVGEGADLIRTLRAWHKDEARFFRFGKNPSLQHSGLEQRNFLGPEVPVMDGWLIRYRANEDLRMVAADGKEAPGLKIENADIVSLTQTYPVVSGRTYHLAMEAAWQVSPDNRTWVRFNWESTSGKKLRTDVVLRLPNGNSGGLQALEFVFTSPPEAYNLKVAVVTNRQYEGDYLEIKEIDFGKLVPKR